MPTKVHAIPRSSSLKKQTKTMNGSRVSFWLKKLCEAMPKMSALINGKLSGFLTVRLFRFLNSLGRDVEIVVKDKPRSRFQALTQVVNR